MKEIFIIQNIALDYSISTNYVKLLKKYKVVPHMIE